ncbi:hypothetical protein VPNG_07284 [Cytospora leucostoma]|uniref:Major facilitator superfamily (MFS) profile domain-containing protein n=1 Tax=Cytospora leucostoma TaxID=1230097 RepID=A0A423WKV7_9PEZI|nr:hypothetical protein VPNG_07284 [Cytospora leucostoma]
MEQENPSKTPTASVSASHAVTVPSISRTPTRDSAPQAHLAMSRKVMILITAAWMCLAATFASTALFPANSEVAADFNTTTEIINYANAGLILAMAFSSFLWNPLSRLIGRKIAYLIASMAFALFSVGAALSKTMATFVTMRIMSGFESCFFLVAGQAMVAESFEARQRGTAVGFLMSGTTSGPAIGPLVGAIIVTLSHWRVIFWLQAGMAFAGMISALFFVPWETRPTTPTPRIVATEFNPLKVLRWLLNPNILFSNIACGCLSWMQYSLLTPVRYLIDPRFNLQTPLLSGLFYLSPGVGFVLGTIGGGWWADLNVRKYIVKRGGIRIPEDRLHSGLVAFFLLLPGGTLTYGWCLEYVVGGLPLAAIAIFFSCLGLMMAISSLNTYTAEVIPESKRNILASKYLIQYIFCAVSTATIMPLIGAIGVGWAMTISHASGPRGACACSRRLTHLHRFQRWQTRPPGPRIPRNAAEATPTTSPDLTLTQKATSGSAIVPATGV